MSEIKKLHENVQASRDAWAAAIANVIPIGTVVEVFIGQAPLAIEVTGFSTNSWHECCVHGLNVKTGARRHCHFHQIIGYDFSEYDRFGSLYTSLPEQARKRAQEAKQEEQA